MPEPELPIARVVVDVPLAHLDRPFDYAVTADQDADAVPGARVRVRFSGRLRDGFVLERCATSDHEGPLTPLHKVVSAEPVLTAEIAGLVRAVADHYAGTFADVLRLAVPPRHAATERAEAPPGPAELPADPPAGPLVGYPTGAAYLQALRDGRRPRAMWQVTPSATDSGDWAAGLASAARACAEGDRGAVIVVPDQRDLERLSEACTAALGPAGFAVLVAETGPAARYRSFLAARRGQVRVVIGNRAAAYAPVGRLGLVALFDDGDDLLSEPRAPYPHTRDVLALRAAAAGAGVLFAGYSRTAEVQAWLERGWLRELAEDRPAVRHTAPQVRVTADSDWSLERDPAARVARLPHQVFEMMRAALPQGPVLVQVPRSGYRLALVCQGCREPVRCRFCCGPTGRRLRCAAGLPLVRPGPGRLDLPDLRVAAGAGAGRRGRSDGGGAGPRLPADSGAAVGRRSDGVAGARCPSHRRGHSRGRATGRSRLLRCGAAGHRDCCCCDPIYGPPRRRCGDGSMSWLWCGAGRTADRSSRWGRVPAGPCRPWSG